MIPEAREVGTSAARGSLGRDCTDACGRLSDWVVYTGLASSIGAGARELISCELHLENTKGCHQRAPLSLFRNGWSDARNVNDRLTWLVDVPRAFGVGHPAFHLDA